METTGTTTTAAGKKTVSSYSYAAFGKLAGRYFAAALFFYAAMTFFLNGAAIGEKANINGKGKVLVINSDSTVDKYNLVKAGFLSNINFDKVEINLNDPGMDETHVSGIIKEESPDIVYTIGTKAYMYAFKLANGRGHVFTAVLNWRRLPVNDTTYGISDGVPQAIQLNMFHYFFPDLKTVGILYSESYNKSWVDLAVNEGRNVNISVIGKTVSKPEEVGASLKELLTQADAVWLIPDPVVLSKSEYSDIIFKESANAKKPVFAYSLIYKQDGAVFIITSDIPTTARQSAALVKELIRNGSAVNKVQDPAGTFIFLNQKKAMDYGMKLNEEALPMVNQFAQ
ncbi:MAG: hypothetical protein HQK89_18100 [Nitrospirae bacterium]|nr:hypothetical protein [Nitrospirota bacterium]